MPKRRSLKKDKVQVVDTVNPHSTTSTSAIDQFTPTKEQKTALNVIRGNTISFIIGPAGSGKTACTTWDYCKEYLKDHSKQIYIIKSPTEAGQLDKVGFLKGNLEEKLEAHFVANRKLLEEFLGKGKVECDLGKRIHLMVPNYCLGQTFDNALVLVEEAQQLQPMILKLLLERTGLNTRVCVVGDPEQLYTDSKESKLRNGLSDAVNRFFDSNGNPHYNNVGMYKFSIDSIVRSEIVKTVVRAYHGDY